MRSYLSGPSLAFAIVGALFAVLPSVGVAQVVNPTIAEFTPSPDHSRLASDGTAWVTRYDLGFYQQGASSPFQVASLGKPAPAADGNIRINMSTLTVPSAGIVYQARVIAVGPGGSTPSAASNTFMFAASCTYTVTPALHTIASGAWIGAVDLSTGTNCQWTGTSNDAGWLGFSGGGANTGGTGSARVSIYAVANTSASERTGTVTVAGQTITIRQSAVPCTLGVSPANITAAATGGAYVVSVTGPSGCSWTATGATAPWLTVVAGSGSGNGSFTLRAAANTSTSQRTASVTAAGQIVRVTQNGAAPCAFSVSETAQSFASDGGQNSVTVTTGTTCTWSASADSPWITVSSASRTGSGSITYTVASNSLGTPRTGNLTVAGRTVRIDQAGVPCRHTVNPTSLSVPSHGGSASVQVTGPDGCQWSASSSSTPWITITSTASNTVSGQVNLTIAPNALSTTRNGVLTIAGQNVNVIQAAAAGQTCTYSVLPSAHSAPAAGGPTSVEVIAPAGCAWSASSSAAWLTITAGSSGSGRGLLSFEVAVNPLTTSRTGMLSVAGQTVTVTQAAAACGYIVTPTSHTIAAGGGTALGSVTTTSGCAWTTQSSATWLTVSPGRSGTGDYTLTATPNTTTSQRSAVVTIAGTSVSVTQSADTPCQVSVSSSSMTVDGAGQNNVTVQVTAGSGCSWRASSSASWLVIRGGESGSGDGRVTFRVEANTTGSTRTATLTIGGHRVTVSQESVSLPKGPKGVRILSNR